MSKSSQRFLSFCFAMLIPHGQLLMAQQGGEPQSAPRGLEQPVAVDLSEIDVTEQDFEEAGGTCQNGVCIVSVEQLTQSPKGAQAVKKYEELVNQVEASGDRVRSSETFLNDLERQVPRPRRHGSGTECCVISGGVCSLVTTVLVINAGVWCLIIGGALYGACNDDNPGCPKIHGERGFDTMIAGGVLLPVGILMACFGCYGAWKLRR